MIPLKPKLCMLVLDDAESIRLILHHYFKDIYIVKTLNNGKEALSWMMEGNEPDIIVADINMPEMDGFAFIEQSKSSGYLKDIPLLILSVNDNVEDKIRCLEAGADDFMVKPFNLRELNARINGIFKRYKKNEAVQISNI